MAGHRDDDRVMATASHILRSLGSNNANDMLHILSSFDDRFSRFSLSLRRHGATATPSPASASGAQAVDDSPTGFAAAPAADSDKDFAAGDAALESAEETILRWDFGSSETARQTFLWTDQADEVPTYLDAVDRIQRLIDSITSENGTPLSPTSASVLDSAQNLLQLAMLRLEEELRNLMETHGESVDPDVLFDIAFENDLDDSGAQGDGASRRVIEVSIDLLPLQVLSDLCDIATRMVNAGYQAECTQVFEGVRKGILEESLQRLGLERLTIEEVHRMPWELLESEITKWVRIMKLTIGVLFRSERQLCERVFRVAPSLADVCFLDIARTPLTSMLNFGEAVAISRRTPEKLFKILDMYESLWDLLPSIEFLFSGEPCTNLRSEASAILTRLAEAARGTFAEFENAVQRETSRNPIPGGAVHPLTRYVMNYMRFLSDYTETLNQLLQDRKAGVPLSRSDTDKSPLSSVTLSLMGFLEKNLDAKSKLYKDPALASIFLMNNLHYIVQKVKDSDIRKLVGDEWIKRHSGKLHQYHNDYRRTAWTKVLSFLRDDGISFSGGSSSGASRNVLKERFKNFNLSFEENVKAQSGWIVSDPQLCTELRISVTEMLLPAYRSFLGRFQNHLDMVKNPEKYLKYTPEDLEAHLNDLFEGSSGSMNRRKSLSTAGMAV